MRARLGALVPKPDRGPAGLWTLVDGNVREVACWEVGPAVALVPSEDVLLLAVDLPLASAARRLESLPFAIEDRLGEDFAALHLALGIEVAPRRYLAAVVREARMREWVDKLDAAGLGHCAVVPDALALPRPADGGWAVEASGGRAVVRTAEAGFAIPEDQLALAWETAGRPSVTAYGSPLPDGFRADPAPVPAMAEDVLRAPAIDLRQGVFRRKRAPLPPIWRRVAIVAACGVVAHATIAAADTLILSDIAAKREAETRALVSVIAPGVPAGDDLASTAADLLPAPGSGGGTMLTLLSQAATALAPAAGSVATDQLGYDGRALTLDLRAADAAALDRATAALRQSGLKLVATAPAASPEGFRVHIIMAGGGA